ncbi:MAG: hypothetical protein WCP08_06430 [Prolixibacteraceae bacterium]
MPGERYRRSDPTELDSLGEKEADRLKKMTAQYERWEKEVGVNPAKIKSTEE